MRNATLLFGLFALILFATSCSIETEDNILRFPLETKEQSLFSQNYHVAKHAFSDGRRAKVFRIFPNTPGIYYVIKMPENDTVQLDHICRTKPSPHFNLFEEKWEIKPKDIMVDDNDFVAVDTLNIEQRSDGIFDQITMLSKENSTSSDLIESE